MQVAKLPCKTSFSYYGEYMVLLELKGEQGSWHPSKEASKAQDTPEQPHCVSAFCFDNFQELATWKKCK